MEAKISYMQKDDELFKLEKPYVSLVPFLSQGANFTNTKVEEHVMSIIDVRGREAEFDLDTNGFTYVSYTSQERPSDIIKGPDDPYVKEMGEFLKKYLGARSVTIYDGNTRKVGDSKFLQASTYAHVDHSRANAQWRLEKHLEESGESGMPKRWQFINIWVPMNGPVLGSPLAVCDYQSTGPQDLIAVDSVFPHRVMETYHVQHNSQHRWHYLSCQTVNEVLIFKTCDSDDTKAHYCMHSAITPETSEGVIVRESVELRCIVLY